MSTVDGAAGGRPRFFGACYDAITSGRRRHGRVWFNQEGYVIRREPASEGARP